MTSAGSCIIIRDSTALADRRRGRKQGARKGEAKRSITKPREAASKTTILREGEQSSRRTQADRNSLSFNIVSYRGVAQLVARLLWEQDAGCSSHLTPTTVAGPGATCAPGPPFIKIFSGQSSPFLMGDFILKNTNGYALRALCFLCWRHRRKTGKKRSCHNFRYCALYKNIEKY